MQNLHSLSDKKKLDKTPLILKRCPTFSSLLNIKLFLYKIVITHQNTR